jgi:glucan 1,3-beta-glucosidase
MQKTISKNNLNKDIQIITHDSFMGPTKFVPLLNSLNSPIQSPTFGVDQHNYQLYTDSDNALDQPAHIQEACGWASALSQTKAAMPVYVGEWSALTNVCVDSNGSTFPGGSSSCKGSCKCTTDDISEWNSQVVEQVRKYVEAQLDVFEANSDGHFIWSFKAGGGWGVYNLIEAGAFPNPITDRKYGNQCS